MTDIREFQSLEDSTFEPITNALAQAEEQGAWLNNQVSIANNISIALHEEHFLKDASVEGLKNKNQSEGRGHSL